MPAFRAPYPCGEAWTASTRAGHGGNGNAVDFNLWPQSLEKGKPVLAAAGGIAKFTYGVEGGNMVFVDHGGGWTTGYAHLDTWTIDNPIEPGERIGTVGGSGSAGGTPTLHYAARLSNISQPVVFAGVTIPVGWNNYSPSAPKTTSTNCGAPPVQVLPVAQPTFLDPCGARNDRYVVPLSTGAQYLSGASVKPARTYWGRGTVTLMANTLPGFQLTGTTTWSHTFSTAPC